MKKISLFTLTLVFLIWGTNAFAVPYGFTDLKSELGDPEAIYDNFSWTVNVDEEAGTVEFTISNNGPDPSFIAGVYFEGIDGLLAYDGFTANGIEELGGVDFSTDKTKNVPGGNGNDTGFTTDVSALAVKNGTGKSGIDQGESATFIFTIVDPSFNVIEALNNEELRIALQVQGIGGNDGGSDSYIAVVPEPATMLLLGAGLIGIAGLGRKKLFKKK